MTQVLDQFQQRRQDWISRVRALADQVAQWSAAQGWQIDREDKTIEEESLGSYRVPMVRVRLPAGELLLNPIALHVIGGDGRVDLEAVPTLARVQLFGPPG